MGQISRMITLMKKLKSFNSLISIAIFLVVITILSGLGLSRSIQGTNSADDAWIALSAKNLASGKGYSTSISNEKQIYYDPFISTGPILVVPASLAIAYFGNESWVPGGTQIFVYITQIFISALVLSKFFGWRNSLFFLATLNFLLIYLSLSFWMFGSLIGEPVAFGFILLGIIFLCVSSSYQANIFGSFCFALAILTKQISLFPILGALAGLLFLEFFGCKNLQLICKKYVLISIVLIGPIVFFEFVKLINLGYKPYLDTIITATKFGINFGEDSLSLIERFSKFLDVLNFYYSPLLIFLILLSFVYLFLIILFPRITNKYSILDIKAFNILILLAFSSGSLFLYVCFISPRIWERYLWIGISLFLASILVFLLVSTFKQRIIFLLTFILIIISFNGIEPLLSRIKYSIYGKNTISTNRQQIVTFLDKHKNVPYAADYWTSIFDIVYLKQNEGYWRFGQDIIDLKGRNFYAIINNKFTHKDWNFYKYVNSLCKPLITSEDYELHNCDQEFWSSYTNN